MKNYLLLSALAIAMIFAISCTEEQPEQPQVLEKNFEVESNHFGYIPNRWRFCIYDIIPGRKIYFPGRGYLCLNSPGICSFKIRKCFEWIEFDPCLFPCGIEIIDPWDIYEFIDPRELISIPDKFDIKVDPKTAMIPFPVNEHIIGLQMFNKMEEVMDGETLILESDMELDEKFAEENGLSSNVIPAGKYPVLFNKENETFNAFVSVGKRR